MANSNGLLAVEASINLARAARALDAAQGALRDLARITEEPSLSTCAEAVSETHKTLLRVRKAFDDCPGGAVMHVG